MNSNQHNGAGLSQPSDSCAQKLVNVYKFDPQKKKGKKGEQQMDEWLKLQGYQIVDLSQLQEYLKQGIDRLLVDVSEEAKYQKAGIDRLLIRLNGFQASLEYKTDLKAIETDNLFFEYEKENIPTWGLTSQADFWIFWIPGREILIVTPGKFRLLVLQQIDSLKKRPVQNLGYSVNGLLVPIEKVRKIADYVCPLPFSLFGG